MPECASCEGFEFAGRVFNACDASYDVCACTGLCARYIAISHEDIARFAGVVSFNTDEAMEDVFALPSRDGDFGENNVTFLRHSVHWREDDRVFVPLNERPHTDAGRRETHFLSLR